MTNTSPFRDRRTSLIEVVSIAGVNIKLYGICARGAEIADATVNSAHSFMHREVAFGSAAKFGFAVLHHGEEAMWLLVDWWIEDILHQQLFWSSLDDVNNFQPGPPNHEMACVWELSVITHERNAWVKHTMLDPERADFDAYLADALSIK